MKFWWILLAISLVFAIGCTITLVNEEKPNGYVGGHIPLTGDPTPEELAGQSSNIGFYDPVIIEQNPYNPFTQPGRYSNYQLNHPDAVPMSKEQAEQEVKGD
jgi:hypothetical protein